MREPIPAGQFSRERAGRARKVPATARVARPRVYRTGVVVSKADSRRSDRPQQDRRRLNASSLAMRMTGRVNIEEGLVSPNVPQNPLCPSASRGAMLSFIAARGAREPTWVPSRGHRTYSSVASDAKAGNVGDYRLGWIFASVTWRREPARPENIPTRIHGTHARAVSACGYLNA